MSQITSCFILWKYISSLSLNLDWSCDLPWPRGYEGPDKCNFQVCSAPPLLDWLDCHKKTGYPATSAKWRRAESPADSPVSCPARLVRQSGTTWSQQRLQVHEWPFCIQNTEMSSIGTSLVVQWLRLCLAIQGAWVHFLVGEIRAHKPCGHNTKT